MKEKPLKIYRKNGHFTPDPTGVRAKEAIAQPFLPYALQQVHADGETPLIFKDERMGALLCVDIGDVNGDGLQEIVVGSTGAVEFRLLWSAQSGLETSIFRPTRTKRYARFLRFFR